jgi:hypothetical protein
MTTYNIVRFRTKPGQQQAFLDHHSALKTNFSGMLKGTMVKTGDQTFCLVGEWGSRDDLVAARAKMIEVLDGMRPMLEDLGGGLGVTDAVSGEAVLDLK